MNRCTTPVPDSESIARLISQQGNITRLRPSTQNILLGASKDSSRSSSSTYSWRLQIDCGIRTRIHIIKQEIAVTIKVNINTGTPSLPTDCSRRKRTLAATDPTNHPGCGSKVICYIKVGTFFLCCDTRAKKFLKIFYQPIPHFFNGSWVLQLKILRKMIWLTQP